MTAQSIGNVVGAATPNFAASMGDKQIADALCHAACNAMEDKKQQDAKIPPPERPKGFQQFMASRLSSGFPSYIPKAANPRILSEVTAFIPKSFGQAMTIALSATRKLAGSSFAAPTGLIGGLLAGALAGRGWTTRWDHVILANPANGCVPSNIQRYVEVKFPGDQLTKNQRRAKIAMNSSDGKKRVEMHPETDCVCSKT